jgi:hypothetical protein
VRSNATGVVENLLTLSESFIYHALTLSSDSTTGMVLPYILSCAMSMSNLCDLGSSLRLFHEKQQHPFNFTFYISTHHTYIFTTLYLLYIIFSNSFDCVRECKMQVGVC